MTKNQEYYKQELIKKIKEMQDKKAFGVIKVHIQDGNINKINAHITKENEQLMKDVHRIDAARQSAVSQCSVMAEEIEQLNEDVKSLKAVLATGCAGEFGYFGEGALLDRNDHTLGNGFGLVVAILTKRVVSGQFDF